MGLDEIGDWFGNISDFEISSEIGVVFLVFLFFSLIVWGSRLYNNMLTLKFTVMIQVGAVIGLIGCIIWFKVRG
jgi:hypothetical protein